MPIYQGGAEDAAVRQAKELRAQAEMNVTETERQVLYATRAAWQAYTSAQATIASNQAQVDANEVAYQGVKLEQQVGGRTILDVLNAEQELLNAQVNACNLETRRSGRRLPAIVRHRNIDGAWSRAERARSTIRSTHYDDNAAAGSAWAIKKCASARVNVVIRVNSVFPSLGKCLRVERALARGRSKTWRALESSA